MDTGTKIAIVIVAIVTLVLFFFAFVLILARRGGDDVVAGQPAAVQSPPVSDSGSSSAFTLPSVLRCHKIQASPELWIGVRANADSKIECPGVMKDSKNGCIIYNNELACKSGIKHIPVGNVPLVCDSGYMKNTYGEASGTDPTSWCMIGKSLFPEYPLTY